MARNKYPGPCYRCGGYVGKGEGHFERFNHDWKVQHAACALEAREKKAEKERALMPKLKTWYFTFGQVHTHSYNGMTFDKDCVVAIEAEGQGYARAQMFEAFGDKWSFQYNEWPDMSFFPRGAFNLKGRIVIRDLMK